MSLAPGVRLGAYDVLAFIGAGGMGEVYRARDSNLNRDVALKILPGAFASDPDRLTRFTREAQTLAALNHPNIAHIHGLEESGGVRALVMELVEGDDLAQRIARGPIPLDEALPIAKQITEALEAAHEAGIIHRDLKPANIKVRPDGTVKVLDFGLAKALESEIGAVNISQSPTITSPAMTRMGVIMGTAAYMPPEQARGKAVDKRADIWAFGCVLYEMLTAKRAIDGDTFTDIVVALMTKEPDWTALPLATPPRVVELLRRCLKKEPRERLRDIGDARLEIDQALSSPPDAPVPYSRTAWRWGFLWIATGLIVGGVLATIIMSKLPSRDSLAASSPKQLALDLPPSIELVSNDQQALALSPDGKHLVFPGRQAGVIQLYDRPIDHFDVSPIPGTEGATQPFFSPDGRWVGFFAGGKLKKIALTGGTPATICDVAFGQIHGAAWGPDDMILFGGGGLFRVPAAGGSPERLTAPDPNQDESDHELPNILPGGQAVLFTIWTGGFAHPKIAVQSLKTGQRRILLTGVGPHFVPTGHIVFFRAGSLWAVPFDPTRLELTGSPTPVVQGIHVEWAVWPYFTLANDGTLVYVPGAPLDAKRLVWVDRKGTVQPLNAPLKPYDFPRLSPDGKRVAIVIREDENHDIWTHELERGTLTRLTFDPGEDETPVWMPDGQSLIFAGNRSGASRLLSARADGSGIEEEVLGTRGGHRHAYSVSPDGEVLAFQEYGPTTGSDIWIVPLKGDRKARPFLKTPFEEGGATLSPDGRWIAYASDESGRSEVFVQPYPGPGGKWQVSTEGGVEPTWARSSRELFYRNGDKMWVAEVKTQPSFSASQPRVLFQGRYDTSPWYANYDVTPDGQRFLMVQPAEPTSQSQLNIVLNWFEELKRLVPAKR
jgi:serine/threonine protein kinase/Tol biopolymer transport system component